MDLRWDNYVFGSEDEATIELMRAGTSADCASLYVLGVGLDPRCLEGLTRFLSVGRPAASRVVRIELPRPTASSQTSAVNYAAKHLSKFESLTRDLEVQTIPYPVVESPSSAGPAIARRVTDPEYLRGVGHLVLDVSSLPSKLYFSILKAMLNASELGLASSSRFAGQIQVIACENPSLDKAITEQGVSTAAFVGGFRPHGQAATDGDGTIVWTPVIGEGAGTALRAVHSFLEPDDICPVLPFPSWDPRRADTLVLEHGTVLFDAFQVRGSDIVYADERNPFDLYRKLCDLDHDYKAALAPLGPTMVVPSSHGSKLLSLGLVLAAYERQMPLVATVATDYAINEMVDIEEVGDDNRLCCLWLAGEPYAA